MKENLGNRRQNNIHKQIVKNKKERDTWRNEIG